MHQPVFPSRLIDKPVHHAGLPEAPRRRQQNMTEAELFPNQIDERLAFVAVRAPYRRSNKITWHATIMSHNKIVAQPLNWVHVVILAYAQASAPASCPTVWTIKAQVLESKPSDVRVMMGEWRDEPSSGSVAGEAGGCPPGDLRSGGGATSSRYGKSCCMWLHWTEAGIWRAAGCRAGRPVQRHRDQANDVASGCVAMHPRGEGWGIPRAVVERKRRVRMLDCREGGVIGLALHVRQ